MQPSLDAGSPAAPIATPRSHAPIHATRLDSARPATVLQQALLLGISADALLRDALLGPALAVWVIVLALAVPALAWSADRRVPRESVGWLATALLFAGLTAWRDSPALRAFDFLVVLGALGMAGIAIRDDRLALRAARLRDTLWAAAAIIGNVARGVVPLALRQLFDTDPAARARGNAHAILRAVAIAATLAFVFGSLLRSADPIFARLVVLPDIDFDSLASHVVVTCVFAWIVGGWAYGAFIANPVGPRPPERSPITLHTLELTTALGTLNVLFGVFVLTQLGWFFGGEHFLRETTGLTAAQYARQGFFQMVWVVVLVVPILLATRAALAPERALARRHTRLAMPIVALLGAIILSAALRMRLYVHYFGLTSDRLLTLVFMGWLAIVLALLAGTVLRDRGRPFVAASIVSALITLAGLHVVVPDLVIARVNIARAEQAPHDSTATLDLGYLAELSAEAVPLATAATLSTSRAQRAPSAEGSEQQCVAASELLRRWGPDSKSARLDDDSEWREWNAGAARARRIVSANARSLFAVKHEACAVTRRARLATQR